MSTRVRLSALSTSVALFQAFTKSIRKPNENRRTSRLSCRLFCVAAAFVALLLPALSAWSERPTRESRVHSQKKESALRIDLNGGLKDNATASGKAAVLSHMSVPLRFEPNVGQMPNDKAHEAKESRFVGRGAGYTLQLAPTAVAVELAAGKDEAGAAGTLHLGLAGASNRAHMTAEDKLPGVDSYYRGPDQHAWRTGIATYGRVAYSEVYPGIDLAFYGRDSRLEYDFIVKPGADASQVRIDLGGMNSASVDAAGDLRLDVGSRQLRLLRPVVYQTRADGKSKETIAAGYRLEHGSTIHFTLGKYDHTRPLIIDPVLTYAAYLTNWNNAIDVQVDGSGNIYVLTLGTASQGIGGEDVLKFNAAGTLLYDASIVDVPQAGYCLQYTVAPMALRLDTNGRAYVAGFAQAGYPTTSTAYQPAYPNASTCYSNSVLSVFSADGGSLVYSTYFGGVDTGTFFDNLGLALAVDASGNAYLAGEAGGTNFPVTAGAYQSTYLSGSTAAGFVAKINPSLSGTSSLLYSTLIGSSSGNGAASGAVNAIAVDASGDAFLAGNNLGLTAKNGGFSYSGAYSSNGDGSVTEFNPTGTALIYSAYLGPVNPNAIALDKSGDVYIAGSVSGEDYPTTAGAYQTSYPDGFVSELNPAGSALVYSTFLSGPSGATDNQHVVPGSIALPPGCVSACAAYISGYTNANDFPAVNAIQAAAGALPSGFVVELAGNGASAVYSTYLGGINSSAALLSGSVPYVYTQLSTPHIAVDGTGNAYVAGTVNLTPNGDFPITAGAVSTSSGAYLAKIAATSAGETIASPTAVAFGNVPVGISSRVFTGSPIPVVLRNMGSAPVTLQPFVLTPGTIFTETDNCGGQIAGGGSCTLQLTYTPSIDSTQNGTLTIASSAANSPTTVALSGAGTDGAYLEASSTSLSFGNQDVSTTSAAQVITLKNVGNAPTTSLNFSLSTNQTAIFPFASNCPAILNPSQSCQLSMQFAPVATGLYSTSLYVSSATNNFSSAIAISGNGITTATNGAGILTLSAATMNFNTQLVGTAGAVQNIYFYNTGTVPLTVNSVVPVLTSTQGSVNDFAISYTYYNDYYGECGNPPFQVLPEGYCIAAIAFTPSVAAAETVTLSVNSTSSSTAATLALSGTGVAATQVIEFVPGNQVFNDQPLGITSAPQAFYVYNEGTAPFTVSRVVPSGDFQLAAGYSTNCVGMTLTPPTTPGGYGSDCTVYLSFTPTALGARSGALTLVDPAGGNPQMLNLTGNGIAQTGTLQTNPTSLEFLPQAQGTTSATQPVTLTNPGNAPVTINTITPTGDFAYTDQDCGSIPIVLAANATCNGNVTFTPTSTTNPRTGTLTYASTAGNQVVSLTGTGEVATQAVGFTPSSVSFGSIPMGQTSAYAYTGGLPVYVRNTGTEPVTFNAAATVSANYSIAIDACTNGTSGTMLAPGTSCEIVLNYTPSAVATQTGTLTLADTAGTQTLSLTGTGIASTSVVDLNAQPVAFSQQPVGTSTTVSSPYAALLYNYGTSQVISIASASITAGGANFSIPVGYDNCSGASINPGSQCEIYVIFNPTAPGYLTGTLTYVDTANKKYTATLSGYAPAVSDSAYLSPAGVQFNPQVVGTLSGFPTNYQLIYLNNSGNEPLTVGTVTGTNFGPGAEFLVDNNDYGDQCTNTPLPAGSSCIVGLDFAPSATGARSGSIVFPVTYQDGTKASITATLAGTGLTAKYSAVLTPTTVTFLDQVVGSSSVYPNNYELITLTNSGNQPLTVQALTGTDFGPNTEFVIDPNIYGDQCSGATLAPGSSCTIAVDFVPSATGTRTGSISFPIIYTGGTKSTLTAAMSGKGIAPANSAYLSPTGLVYTDTVVGVTSAAQTISLFNGSNLPLTVGKVGGTDLTANTTGAEFSTNSALGGNDGCSQQVIAPGSSCAVTIAFTPNAGLGRSGTITVPVTYSGATSTVTISGTLFGQGIVAGIGVTLSQSTVNFGSQQLTTTSAAVPILISNRTANAITPAYVLSGTNAGDFATDGGCTSMNALNSCVFNLTFAPAGTGTRTATLTETDAVGTHTISLTGSGTADAPTVVLYPKTLAFSTAQPIGVGSAVQSFSVTNNGTVVLNISKVATSDTAEFPIESDGCTGQTLNQGQSCVVTVSFAPTSAAAHTATITVTDSASPTTQTVSATGTGTADVGSTVTLAAAPTSAAVGAPVILTATVLNASSAPITNGSVTFYNGTTAIGTAQVITTTSGGGTIGTAKLTTRALPLGANSITAKYVGADLPGTAAAISVTITGHYPTTSLLTSTGTQGNYVLTGTVLGAGPFTTKPTGNMVFTDNQTATTLGTVSLASTTAVQNFVTSATEITTTSGSADGSIVVDVNRDGNLDIVGVNSSGSPAVSVFLGNGDGTFQSAIGFGTQNSWTVRAGDLNGDGKLDLVTSNTNGGITVYLGNGDGTFQDGVEYAASYLSDLALVDINGDGLLDVVGANFTSASATVMLGNGDGTFQPAETLASGNNPQAMSVGDFNGDGKIDFATVNQADSTVSVFLGNGNGTFQAQKTYPVASSPWAIATGDVNGDGKLDLVTANNSTNPGTVSVLLGKGDGTFQAASTFIAGNYPFGVAIGDVNGDGYADIVVSNNSDNTVGVLLGAGNGTFGPQTPYAVGLQPGFISLADANHDGRLDIVVSNASGPSVTILLNQVRQTATLSGVTLPGSITDNVTAGYAGDGNYAASTSNALTLPSNSARGVVKLTATPSSGAEDSVFTLTAALTDPFNNPLNEGSITFYDGTTVLGTAQIVSSGTSLGTATFKTRSLPVGSNSLTAAFAGTTSYQPGTSPAVTVTVTGKYASTTALTASGVQGSYTLTAAVDGFGAGNPSGNVVFTDSSTGATLGTVPLTTANSITGFVAAASPATSTNPSGIASGDFNGDGILDLAVANYNDNTVGILIGTGTGGYAAQVTYPAGGYCNEIVAIDINNDGKMDLVTVNISSGTFSVLLGNGNGTFQAPLVYSSGGNNTGTIATADVNDDGKMDVILSDGTLNQVSVFLGNGDGTFQAAKTAAVGRAPQWQIATGDFNRDGKLDLAVTNYDDSTVSVLLGNGDGTFQAQQVFVTGSTPGGVITGDFNGDGKLDLVTSNAGSNNISLLLGNGDGTFQAQRTLLGGNGALAAADLNADGKLDLVAANRGSNNLSVLFGNGDGTFQAQQIYPTGTSPVSLVTGDFNGDARQDIAVANSSSNNVTVLLSTVTNGVVLTPVTLPGFGADTVVASYAGDTHFNGSTSNVLTLASQPLQTTTTLAVTPTSGAQGTVFKLIATVADSTSKPATGGTVTFYNGTVNPNNALGTIGVVSATHGVLLAGTATLETRSLPPGTFQLIAVFSGDGSVGASTSAAVPVTVTGKFATTTAVAVTGTAGNYTLQATVASPSGVSPTGTVTFNDTTENTVIGTATLNSSAAAATFASASTPSVGTDPLGVVSADFNRDGIPDLAVTNYSGGVSILLGTGNGTYQAQVSYPVGSNPYNVVAADFNGDGYIDLAVSNVGSNTISVLLGNGDGTFQPQILLSGVSAPYSLGTGDFNKDGKQDIVTFSGNSTVMYFFAGNGDGTFQAPTTSTIGNVHYGLPAIADFNKDGKLDVAVGNENDGTISVLLGNGDGTFQPQAIFSAGSGSSPYGMAAGDLNGDGNLDLVIAGATTGVAVLLGNGDGTFAAATQFTASTDTTYPVIADLNGDGKLDIAVSNYGSSNVSVLLGNGDGTFQPQQTFATGTQTYGLVAGDMNGDGRTDLVATVEGLNQVDILLGQNTTTATLTGAAVFGSGIHVANGVYGGDGNFSGSTSATFQKSTPQRLVAPVITLTQQPSGSVPFGQTVSVVVTVGGPQGAPAGTGSISYTLDGGTAQSANLTNGTVTLNFPSLAQGSHSLVVNYAANTIYTAGSKSLNITVSQSAQTITFPTISNMTYGAPAFQVFPSSTSGLPVTVKVNSGPATVLNNVVTLTGAGTVVLEAEQAGNSNYAAATPVTQSFTVAQAPLTITINNAAKVYGTANPAFTSTITGLVGTDTVTVTYSTTATSTSAVGTYPITATLSGAALAPTISYTVTPATLTVTKTKVLTVTPANASKVYGTANPAASPEPSPACCPAIP